MLKPTIYSIALVALLAACSKNEQAPPAASTAAPPPAAAPAPAPAAPAAESSTPAATPAVASAGGEGDSAKGEKVYKTTCAMCHATGAGGAPNIGSKPDWEPRIAQGKDTLYTHALKGFTGTKGAMPPKGGNTSLPDDDVKAAVDYMVSKAK